MRDRPAGGEDDAAFENAASFALLVTLILLCFEWLDAVPDWIKPALALFLQF